MVYASPREIDAGGRQYTSYEIEGRLDINGNRVSWQTATLRIKDTATSEERRVEGGNLPFYFCDGDEIYQDGRKIFPA